MILLLAAFAAVADLPQLATSAIAEKFINENSILYILPESTRKDSLHILPVLSICVKQGITIFGIMIYRYTHIASFGNSRSVSSKEFPYLAL